MIATFVGGPRHGSHHSMEHPPLTMDADNVDGTQMRYERRNAPEGCVQQRIAVQIFYAPGQMLQEEFNRLIARLQVPGEQGPLSGARTPRTALAVQVGQGR